MDKILILDFGGQYDLLIARRVRSLHVYAEIKPYNSISCGEIRASGYKGVIFTGGPNSVYLDSSPRVGAEILELGIPVLGICYGHQLMAYLGGGAVSPSESGSEYGSAVLYADECGLFRGVALKSVCWMSHTDCVTALPEGFRPVGRTDKCRVAAMCDEKRGLYGVQFHPEVTHTEWPKKRRNTFL